MRLERLGVRMPGSRLFAAILLASLVVPAGVLAQDSGSSNSSSSYSVADPVPMMNVGGNYMEGQFARMDFAQMYLDQQKERARQQKENQIKNQKLVDSGTVSALDLQAPARAVDEFNRAASLLKAQNAKEAIVHLDKAIAAYPNFVSAHNNLGLAWMDLDDNVHARSEFEAAAKLDVKFPGSYLNLGRLALSQKEFDAAESSLAKAASLLPRDARVLATLAYAQNENHHYQLALETAGRVHGLRHGGIANVHYVAASAGIALKDMNAVQRELTFFVQEDPSNPLAPEARNNLQILARNRAAAASPAAGAGGPANAPASPPQTLANTERLRGQLAALGGDDDDSSPAPEPAASAAESASAAPTPDVGGSDAHWTIRKSVDEVAVFFSATNHGHSVNNLQLSDIQVRDDNQAPEKVLQFTPQSKLPLRLGLLVDTSGSVHSRFSFEKHAAARFVQEMLGSAADLGFVAGFSLAPTVTQDFTADRHQLAAGIDQLQNAGGTALFDAVSFACWKLSAYPERERVARVLVVLTDGEDNSSRTSLKQALQDAEATGVTIYTISTRSGVGDKTDADRVLQALAERSGGEALFPGDVGALGGTFDKLRDNIRSRYLLAYRPAAFMPNGRYHTISIVAQKDGAHLQVHARKGYRARLEAGAHPVENR